MIQRINAPSQSIEEPICSICIANYNGAQVIEDCLRSVFSQDCNFPFEVIVHDDASTDGSAQHIRAAYPQVVLIESMDNAGFCVANNRMVERASGEFVLLLNNDAALFPDALATLYRAAQDTGQPAILGLPQYDFDTGALLDIGSLVDPFLNPVPNMDPGRGEVAMVMGACLWISKSLWRELGGFPEWFGSIGEDLYLCCRARLAGYSVHALGNSGYRHRVGKSFGGGKVQQGRLVTTRRRRALSERNKTHVMILCYPLPLLLAILPIHLALLYLEGALLALLKRDAALWRDIYAPLLPALWEARVRSVRLRREIQKHRVRSVCLFLKPFRWLPWKLEMLFRYGLPQLR